MNEDMEKQRKQRLEEVLDFINKDLRDSDYGQRVAALVELAARLQLLEELSGESRLSGFIQSADHAIPLQQMLESFFVEMMTALEERTSPRLPEIPVTLAPDIRFEKEPASEATLRVRTRTKTTKELIFSIVLRDLDGLPLSSLRRCRECNNWFLHLSKKERIYCSNRCAARWGRRERYRKTKEADSEAYARELEKGRERARKSREEETRAWKPPKGVRRIRLKKRGKGEENGDSD